MEWSSQLLPLFVLSGVVAYLALHELWMWLGSRREPVHGWALGWSLATLAFLVGRLIQRGALEPETAATGSRIQNAAGMLICLCSLLVVRAILDQPAPKRFTQGIIAAALLQVPAILLTTWIVSADCQLRVDLLGSRYYAPYPGTFAFVSVGYVTFMAGYGIWLLRTRGPQTEVSWRGLLAVLLFMFACAINDVLMGMGLLRSIQLVEYGFVVLALSTGFFTVRRVDRIYGRLEEAVRERTHRIRAQRLELEQSEARFRQLAEAAAEGIVVHDGARLLDANDALAEALQTETGSVVGLELGSLFTADSWEVADHVLSGREAGPVEVATRRPDGSTFAAELTGGRDTPAVAGRRVAVLRDITERNEMQARLMLNDRMASLGTLAAGAAHEINNPLAYVIASVQLLEEELLRLQKVLPPGQLDEALSLVEEVATGSARVRAIVRDLRSLSRESIEVGPLDVQAIVDLSLQMAHNEIRHRARLVRRYHDVPPVEANEGKLGQVFLNLLINAAQAIPEGHAADNEIVVAIRPDGETVVIEISDTGEGIDPETAKRIFDPFFTTKLRGQGTGLGLAICHGIITAFGGEIAVETQRGKGSLFRVSLPACAEEVAPPPQTRTRSGFTAGDDRSCRVLVVDDDRAVARAMRRALRDHEVTVAHGGREALACCEAQTFDVILCDLMMPDVTGMEFYRVLQDDRPEVAERVVFVTGGVFSEGARRFLDEVPNKRLEKPVDVSELRSVVRATARRVPLAGDQGLTA